MGRYAVGGSSESLEMRWVAPLESAHGYRTSKTAVSTTQRGEMVTPPDGGGLDGNPVDHSRKTARLGLDAIDVNILLHLAKHWWYRDNPPHPSKASIADCLRVDPSTVRRHIAAMEAAGFIRREARYKTSGGQENNAYHFDGLIKEATPYAEEAVREREQQQKERVARRHRKRPRLVVDNRPGGSGKRK